MPEIKTIDNPSLKSPLLKIGEWGVTGVIWALWIYLFLPLLNLGMWLLGGYFFHRNAIEHGEYVHLLNLLFSMGLWALTVFVLLRGWGIYNYRRFHKRNQRIATPQTTVYELAAVSNLPLACLNRLQSQKEVRWGSVPNFEASVQRRKKDRDVLFAQPGMSS